MGRARGLAIGLLIRVGAVLVWAGPVLAQPYETKAPPIVANDNTLVNWAFTAGFLVLSIVVAFLPAKRSNLR